MRFFTDFIVRHLPASVKYILFGFILFGCAGQVRTVKQNELFTIRDYTVYKLKKTGVDTVGYFLTVPYSNIKIYLTELVKIEEFRVVEIYNVKLDTTVTIRNLQKYYPSISSSHPHRKRSL